MGYMSEILTGWRTLLGLVLVYIFGYPGTILPVLRTLLHVEDGTQRAVIVSVFTIFMNSAPLSLNLLQLGRFLIHRIQISSVCRLHDMITLNYHYYH